MQASLKEFLSGPELLACCLTQVAINKLTKRGVKEPLTFRKWLEEEIRKRLINEHGLTWEHPIHFEGEAADENHSIRLDSEDMEELSALIEKSVPEIFKAASDSFSTALLDDVYLQADEAVTRRRAEAAEFQQGLMSHWAKPFHLLAVQIGLATQLGGDLNEEMRANRPNHDTALTECMTRLHARACQIAGEVEALLLAGFPDGALSRWRTLHEVAVITSFLGERGNDVAQKYLDHLIIDSFDMAKKYAVASEKLGYRAISENDLQKLKEDTEKLKKKYGKDFSNEYGWASETLAIPSPNFSQIEKAVSIDMLRPYYKLASATVHAGPKGTFWKLGLSLDQQNVILAGPTNTGLEEAARLTARSLSLICASFAAVHSTLDAIVWTRVISEIATETENAFLKAADELQDNASRTEIQHARSASSRQIEKLSTRLIRRQGTS